MGNCSSMSRSRKLLVRWNKSFHCTLVSQWTMQYHFANMDIVSSDNNNYVIKQQRKIYIIHTGKIFAVSLGKLPKCCFPSYLELEGRSTEDSVVENTGV